MVLNSKKLTGIPVRTKSGTAIGKLVSLDIDGDTGKLAFVRAVPRGTAAALLSEELLVAWSEIISMDDKEVVVRDAFVPYRASALAGIIHPSPETTGTHLRDA